MQETNNKLGTPQAWRNRVDFHTSVKQLYVHVEELRGATTTLSTAAARGARHSRTNNNAPSSEAEPVISHYYTTLLLESTDIQSQNLFTY